MATATELRQEKGKMIAQMQNQIERLFDFEYMVNSQSKEGKQYRVLKTVQGWSCTCPDFTYRAWTCKHIYAVLVSFKLREEVSKRRIILEPIMLSSTQCQFCGSQKLRKYGLRKNKSGEIQRYLCEFCKRSFSINIGFQHMRHNPQTIVSALELYFRGLSLRNTQKSLRLSGIQVSHKTIYYWIKKYVALMNEYAEKIQPNVSDVWRADEVYVKIKGDQKYLFALMDDETRYWIAQEVADTKERHNPRGLFAQGKEIAGKRPVRLITDGLPSYHLAFKKEFSSLFGHKAEHIQDIAFHGKPQHNQPMERMNGEIRDREKTMRGLKNKDTPVLTGMQIYHNFIREHEGLNGKTPSEACGIEIKGENKWRTLIENASVKGLQPQGNMKKNLEDFV